MVQSSYGSDNYEFCDDNLLRTEKLILAQQKICTYSVDSNSGKLQFYLFINFNFYHF